MLTERYFSSIFFAFIFLSAFLPKVGATLSSFNPPDDREERLHRQLQSMQRGQTVRNVQLTRTGEFWAKASVDIRENFNITNTELFRAFGRRNVIFPDDPRYEISREFSTYSLFEWPLFIVRAKNDRVIMNALDFCMEKGINMRTKSGGHSQVNMNPNFYLDMNTNRNKRMKLRRNTDSSSQTDYPYILKARGAATQGDIYAFLTRQNERLIRRGKLSGFENLAWGGGTAVSVGNVGVTTGGGSGAVKRSLGLASDAVVAVRIALPPTANEKARFIWTDANNEPELFWAVRGCQASNFGVVTEIIYKLPVIPSLIPFNITYGDFDNDYVQVLDRYQEVAPTLSSQFNINFESDILSYNRANTTVNEALFGPAGLIYTDDALPFFQQRPYSAYIELEKEVTITGFYVLNFGEAQSDAESNIETALDPFLFNPDAELHLSPLQSYSTAIGNSNYYRYWLPSVHYQIGLLNHTFDSQTVYDTLIRTTNSGMQKSVSFGIEALGGKIDETPFSETASSGFRNKKFQAESRSFWLTSDTTNNAVADVQDLFQTYYVPSNGVNDTIFVAFPINNLINGTQQYYGEAIYNRLLQVKNTYDPETVLYFQSGIKEFPAQYN